MGAAQCPQRAPPACQRPLSLRTWQLLYVKAVASMFEEGLPGRGVQLAHLQEEVAESQPWSVAEWAVALRFDKPRATALL